ncbi:hypothetical protein C8R44DRAFT_789786 [Mycena epipterygia]|nr:hypothetical protein C8R44DRAFT_789786 [Mycena epipterygia]
MPKPRRDPQGSEDPLTALELKQRVISGENYKNLGNDFFRQGKYTEAAAAYNEAVNVHGTHPVYMSNLAATYLKLEDYVMAEKAASLALVHDPRMTKARFRRGMARKESHQLRAAKTDFKTILREDPSCAEAKIELAAVQRLCEIDGEVDGSDSEDYEFPAPDRPPRDPLPMWLLAESDAEDGPASSDSDNGDLEHVGNGIPCKHHNRKPLGCAKGTSCVYSHAPDARSIPDEEGRNVCLYFLLGSCKFGDRCLYSHAKANLPDFWGDETRIPDVRDLIYQNELAIRDRRLFSKYMGKGPTGSDTLLAVKSALDKARAKDFKEVQRAGIFLAMMQMLDDPPRPPATAPFIIHLTLNKSTTIPGGTVSGLRELVDVTRAKSKKKALSLLSSPALVGVFITDAGITLGKNIDLLTRIAAYALAGGTVVIGGSFKTFERNMQTDLTDAQLETFFRKGWGLTWRKGSHQPTNPRTVALNTQHSLARASSQSLPAAYTLTGLHLNGVRPDAALYLSVGDSQLDVAEFRASGLTETPVAFTELGKGHLGFVGDTSAEQGTTKVIAAMFGLSSSPTA